MVEERLHQLEMEFAQYKRDQAWIRSLAYVVITGALGLFGYANFVSIPTQITAGVQAHVDSEIRKQIPLEVRSRIEQDLIVAKEKLTELMEQQRQAEGILRTLSDYRATIENWEERRKELVEEIVRSVLSSAEEKATWDYRLLREGAEILVDDALKTKLEQKINSMGAAGFELENVSKGGSKQQDPYMLFFKRKNYRVIPAKSP